MTILDEILEHKRQEVEQRKREFPLNNFKNLIKSSNRSFRKALVETERNIVAEIKFASPSAGDFFQDYDEEDILSINGQGCPLSFFAKSYEQGAQAISILTDGKYFSGKNDYLKAVRQMTTIPILRKDFIIDEYQIYESRFIGADAILLIVAALSDEELQKFIKIADSLGMDALVETHTEEEIGRAVKCGASIIGINNRNLKTMRCDVSTTEKLSQYVPSEKTLISESGIKTSDDIQRLKGVADAFLIGSSLMKAKEPGRLLRSLSGVKVKICGLTNKEDVSCAIDAGADYLGFVFYEKSPRAVNTKDCKNLIKHVKEKLTERRKKGIRGGVTSVGVFVNAPLDYVAEVAETSGLDAVQLHGEESNEYCTSLKKKTNAKIIKAIRVKDGVKSDTIQNIAADIVLLDTFSKDARGGTGKRFDWDILKSIQPPGKKIFLAGGITPENVKDAVSFEQIYGIDVSSGVEMKPGKKDHQKILALLNRIKFEKKS